MDDLGTLEYPRHLHQADGAYLRVDSLEAATAALADGWLIDVPIDPAIEIPAGEPTDTAAELVVTVPIAPKGRKRR